MDADYSGASSCTVTRCKLVHERRRADAKKTEGKMPKSKKKNKLGSVTLTFTHGKEEPVTMVVELQSLNMKQGVRQLPTQSQPGFPDFEVDGTVEISLSGYISNRPSR